MTKIIVRRPCPACEGEGYINRHLGCHRCQGAAVEDVAVDLKDIPEFRDIRNLSRRVEHMESGIQELLREVREHTNHGKLQRLEALS